MISLPSLLHCKWQKIIVVISNHDVFQFKDSITGITVDVQPHFSFGNKKASLQEAVKKVKLGSFIYFFKKTYNDESSIYVGHNTILMIPSDGNVFIEEQWLVVD